MEFLLALQFLTRVPVTIGQNVEERNLGRAMAYFPAIGLLLGIFLAAAHAIFSLVFASSAADLGTIILLTMVTGNMHLDGLMDTADGFFSGKPREAVLEIMKDSRVGAHGVTAGCLVLLSKLVLLGQIPQEFKGFALVLFPVLGRWAQVYAAAFYPYVRTGPGKTSFTKYVGKREIVLASAVTLGIIIFLLRFRGVFLAGAAFAGTVLFGSYVCKRIGGITGDTLGAMNEWVEVLSLITLQFLF
ncbi:adenosylcobinamide-GDP ribazoletransferase [Zhaonella formicivorans]|uniref:adenosylcobinamide-GDP ribazoletransferase n=1 Tax=Zhaonella formicivorans TaxID=2528593 RepID=UPI0010E66388|nr:adenosylcobinamide-GDP ribazoletransferase [Zhaonella formicivorans]